MRANCNLLEGILNSYMLNTPVIEIVSDGDPDAKNMKPFALDIARKISDSFQI